MLGVDIIDIKDIPEIKSQKEQRFFIDNFSKRELRYIENSPNQKYTAAVLFSLKESILKCDNSFIDIPFNKINITLKNPLALHPRFYLSYSTLNKKTIISTALVKI
jgi:phosphopantetheine--protein transferase-like protein